MSPNLEIFPIDLSTNETAQLYAFKVTTLLPNCYRCVTSILVFNQGSTHPPVWNPRLHRTDSRLQSKAGSVFMSADSLILA